MHRLPLLGRFAITALVVVAVVGALFGLNTSSHIRERELRAAEEAAELLVRFAVTPDLEDAELWSRAGIGDRARTLDTLVAALGGRPEIVTLLDGTGEPVLGTAPIAELLPPEMIRSGDADRPRRGTTVAPDGSSWLHVRVPVRLADGTAGDVVVTTPLGPVLATIRTQVLRQVSILVVGLGLLFALLYRSVARASATLRQHADERDHAATHDDLTGLPNRVLLVERMHGTLERVSRLGDRAALLLLDLDRFKEVNDTLGHPAGDDLLEVVGQRLRDCLHPSDTLARLGGDEFAVLLPRIADVEAARTVAERLARALDAPFPLHGIEVSIGTSIGISVAPDDATDPTDLLKHADMAMYAAKRSGTEVETFRGNGDERADVDRLALLGGLRRAIEHDQLVLHYQPQLSLTSGGIVAVEALVRWQHPTRGLLGPGAFIDLAEQSGLMGPLTMWVLETACAQLGTWHRAGHDMSIAVNVSPRTLAEPGFAGRIFTSLARWGVDPSRLELEITEHELVEEREVATETLQRLRGLGIRIAIDDFGTGYSSLSYLTELPVDVLKIDRSLVDSFAQREAQATVLRSVAELGHALGMLVVAEGVEDGSSLASLRGLGVDIAQGYALWRPAPATAIDALLAETGTRPAPPNGGPGRAERPHASTGAAPATSQVATTHHP